MVAGKYRVERVLGEGGMGVVVAAEHLSLRQRVAVKFLRPESLARPESLERFVREAQSAAAIQNEHVARIIDVGTQESGAPYIVMEHLTGRDLGDLLRERGRLSAEEAIGYVLQACEAMAEAHARGIVHRDLKPSNLFLASPMGGPPVVKILDFGLAKTISVEPTVSEEDTFTTTDVVMGSVHYMSPEQMRSLKQADLRSDIWALGVILYELVSGQRPFQGNSIPASLIMIGLDPPRPLDPGCAPPGLEAVIMRCLEKDKERRPQTIAELAVLLAPFAARSALASLDRIIECQRASHELRSEASGVRGPPSGHSEASGPRGEASGSRREASGPRGEASGSRREASGPGRGGETRIDPASTAGQGGRATRSRRLAALSTAAAAAAAALWLWPTAARDQGPIEPDRLASFSPLSGPPVLTSPVERARAELGKKLFADPRLSRQGDVACTSCHPLDRYGADGRKLSRGSDDREPPRNTPSIYNVAGFFALLWDGRKDDLVDQAKEVLLSERVMAAPSGKALASKVAAIPEYASRFAAAFRGDRHPVTFENIARALAAYEETLISRGRWDRFLEGDRAALTEEEKAGFNRFVEVGCVSCHFGPHIGANMFQKVGLVNAWPDSRDRGRFEITRRDADWMVFRVPTLRNVAVTAPYFHDGSVSDLNTVIEMMAWHQLGKRLDQRDVRLIRSWLVSLTGDPPAATSVPEARRTRRVASSTKESSRGRPSGLPWLAGEPAARPRRCEREPDAPAPPRGGRPVTRPRAVRARRGIPAGDPSRGAQAACQHADSPPRPWYTIRCVAPFSAYPGPFRRHGAHRRGRAHAGLPHARHLRRGLLPRHRRDDRPRRGPQPRAHGQRARRGGPGRRGGGSLPARRTQRRGTRRRRPAQRAAAGLAAHGAALSVLAHHRGDRGPVRPPGHPGGRRRGAAARRAGAVRDQRLGRALRDRRRDGRGGDGGGGPGRGHRRVRAQRSALA